MPQKSYGLILEAIQDARDFVLGASKMPFIPYQEDGDWTDYLPRYEPQAENYETSGCTVWGAQNQIETFMKGVYGFEPNYSERFTYLLTPVTPRGTNPKKVYDCIRRDGLIDHELMPVSDTLAEFLDRDDLTGSLLAKGQNWLRTHELQYEWLWISKPENWRETLRKALVSCPIGVSVSAWERDENGLYVSDRGSVNNHWCLLYKVDDDGVMHVFDTYDHSRKKLHPDHHIRRAIRIWLNRKTTKSLKRHKSVLQTIIDRLMNKRTLLDVCEEYLGKDASPQDAAPDELGCADTVTTLMRKVYPSVPHMVSTVELSKWLSDPKNGYARVNDPEPEDIIVSPTSGTKVGHTGIFLDDDVIASNDSGLYHRPNQGKFFKNYSMTTWTRRFRDRLGLPVYVFRRIIK